MRECETEVGLTRGQRLKHTSAAALLVLRLKLPEVLAEQHCDKEEQRLAESSQAAHGRALCLWPAAEHGKKIRPPRSDRYALHQQLRAVSPCLGQIFVELHVDSGLQKGVSASQMHLIQRECDEDLVTRLLSSASV